MKVLHLLSGGGIGGIETLCKNFSIYSKHDNIFVFLWTGGPIADEMRGMDRKVIFLNGDKKDFFGVYKKIFKICVREKIEVIIAHHADPISHYCLLRLKRNIPNVKTIAYAHGHAKDMCVYRHFWVKKIKYLVIKKSLRKADAVVAISNLVKESVVDFFDVNAQKISVIYNGVDIKKFVSNYGGVKCGAIKIIYVGRIIEQKGVQVTLRALSQLKDIDYTFKIVGDGTYRNTLENLAQDLGIGNRVEFTGSRRDVSELLRQSGIFIHMPVWEEGFGITIIEAMSTGLPCICARSGAIPEIIEDGKNGFIVEKGNADMLAQKIRQVATMSDNDLKILSHNAVERAHYFSIERFTNNLDKLIEEVAKH